MTTSVRESETRYTIVSQHPENGCSAAAGNGKIMRQADGLPPLPAGEGGDDPRRCDCEQPGPYYCGVPGVLAYVRNGLVAHDCRVERCDCCQRFPSDAAAVAKLREVGLFESDDPRAEATDVSQPTFSVHCYVTVRVKLPQIPAPNPRDAARRARDCFCWDRYQSQAEFADEITELLVDFDGDEDFRRSVRFSAELEELGP